MHTEPNEPVAYSIKDTCRFLSIGRTFCYRLIAEKKLHLVKLGRRSLVTAASVKLLLESTAI
jgi:excisionase family DNA binding protein